MGRGGGGLFRRCCCLFFVFSLRLASCPGLSRLVAVVLLGAWRRSATTPRRRREMLYVRTSVGRPRLPARFARTSPCFCPAPSRRLLIEANMSPYPAPSSSPTPLSLSRFGPIPVSVFGTSSSPHPPIMPLTPSPSSPSLAPFLPNDLVHVTNGREAKRGHSLSLSARMLSQSPSRDGFPNVS